MNLRGEQVEWKKESYQKLGLTTSLMRLAQLGYEVLESRRITYVRVIVRDKDTLCEAIFDMDVLTGELRYVRAVDY